MNKETMKMIEKDMNGLKGYRKAKEIMYGLIKLKREVIED
jgi:hypothetical protein